MDDVAVLSKRVDATIEILGRLDELKAWSRIRFKAKKSRNVTFVKGKQK